jgi:6-pyruvoyl-tetrahydropterin synthase
MQLFVDNLTNIDFSFLCPERGLVGETWLVSLELTGMLDQQSMICDFGVVKRRVREWMDQRLDHCLLVPQQCPQISSQINVSKTSVQLQLHEGEIRLEAPSQAVTLVDVTEICTEDVARWSETQLRTLFGDEIEHIRVMFTPEHIDSPYYHYSHGLKKHAGQCQRIAHGHRSKLLIWRNDQLCEKSMRNWANRLQNIYIGTREDCTFDDGETLEFAYTANQGGFRLRLPKKLCFLMDTDTTVEQIAVHLAQELAKQSPGQRIRVKAFEGIGKGAIADALSN